MFSRSHKQLLINRLINEPRRFIQVVYGPRQIGKTTLLKQLLDEITIPSKYVSADGNTINQPAWISEQWEIARLNLKISGSTEGLLVIDEIQKIHNWSETIKKEWDADTLMSVPLKVVLLGSSRLLIQQGLTESLAGRFETVFMGHWSYSEMRDAFGFDEKQYIWFGGYPGGASLIQDEQRWKNYISGSLIDAAISRDILMLTRIDKPALLKRLFELGCNYSGQILSFNKILGQLQDAGNTTTLSRYLDTLDTAGLLGGIEKFSLEKVLIRSSSPKFQVYNNALMSALSNLTLSDIGLQPGIWGRWIESSVGSHLINRSVTDGFSVYYWRERNFEIDFVIRYHDKVAALEVKGGSKAKFSGIDAFRKIYPQTKVYLVGNSGIPIGEFLKVNPIDLF